MENIYNNYKNIVERAIVAGVIPEESKSFYLSAIREENDSELSELETLLNKEESKVSSFRYKQKNKDNDILKPIYNGNNYVMDEKMEIRVLNCDDSQSILSQNTIENYSILDIKSPQNEFLEDTDSNISSIKQKKANSTSTHKLESTRIFSKVMKKPRKNQIIDFNVPIYIDIKKKKSTIKPHASHITNWDQCEILNQHSCKKTCSNFEENKKTQIISKLKLPKSKIPVANKNKSIPTANMKTFNVSSTVINQSGKPTAEDKLAAFQKTDKLTKRKSVYTCSAQKGNSELYEENSTMIPKNLQHEPDINACCCMNQEHRSSQRRLRLNRDFENQEHKYKMKLKPSTDFDAHPQSCNAKYRLKDHIHVAKQEDKCNRCKCICSCKSVQLVNNATIDTETTSETGTSVLDAPIEKHSQRDDCDKYLKVNIICQFYQDGEVKKQDDIQNIHLINDSSEDAARTAIINVAGGKVLENEKAGKNNRIHCRLSKLLKNMKIKKKQNI